MITAELAETSELIIVDTPVIQSNCNCILFRNQGTAIATLNGTTILKEGDTYTDNNDVNTIITNPFSVTFGEGTKSLLVIKKAKA